MWLDLSPKANEPLTKTKARKKKTARAYGQRAEEKGRDHVVITETRVSFRFPFIPEINK